MASLAERTASPWTATSMRDRPELVRRCVWQWTVARQPTSMVCWCRSDGGEDSAPRPPQQRATSATLAPPRRHRCRHGMVAADCTWFRSCSETVVAPAALNNQQNLAELTMIAVVSRARGGRPPMMVPSARRELGGGARQQSGFNNFGEGGSYGIAR